MLARNITPSISHGWFEGRIIMLLGPRQVGKTTLIDAILENIPSGEVIHFSGDRAEDVSLLSSRSFAQLDPIIGNHPYIVIDEAQKIEYIGTMLKILTDTYKTTKQIFVTGSSSFRLVQMTEEPLTGRKRVYHLYPFSL
jgi:predicted AAA+ superfamily ATPase